MRLELIGYQLSEETNLTTQTAALEQDNQLPSRHLLAETKATMRRVLAEEYGIESPDLSDNAEISALGLDSLSFAEYAFELEGVLHVEFDDLPRDLRTVGDFVRFVHSEVVRQNPHGGSLGE